jgi:pyruvate/2-oxoglutarate dehydrogenase complex dihydrolipoamide dehydrogenase (E3) component
VSQKLVLPEHREDGPDGRDKQGCPAAQPQKAAEKSEAMRREVDQDCRRDCFLLYGQNPGSRPCVRHHVHHIVLARQMSPSVWRGHEIEIEIEVDAILLQLGFKTALGPLKDWNMEISKGAIVVDQVMKTNLPQVWACGDITTFPGKLKLIATGFSESAIAVAQAVQSFRPEMKIQPKYSTNTGVPGGVGGQP